MVNLGDFMAEINDNRLNEEYFIEQYGENFKIFVQAETETALRKAILLLNREFGQGGGGLVGSSFISNNKNFAEIGIESEKNGKFNLLLTASDQNTLSKQFSRMLNSKDVQRLGKMSVRKICRNGVVTKMHANQEADEFQA